MKTALYVGGAAVGLVLLWKYVLKPSTGSPVTVMVAPPPLPNGSIAASSMTAAGAATTSTGGIIAAPGLLSIPAAGGASPGARNIAALKAADARSVLRQVLASDRAPATVAPSPNGFNTTTVGTPGVEGTLSTGDGVDQRLLSDRNSVGGIYN